MNKKLMSIAIVTVAIATVTVVVYFFVLPMFASKEDVPMEIITNESNTAENSTTPDSKEENGNDEGTTLDGGGEVSSVIGESNELDLVADSSDAVLGDDLAVDLSSLTEEQKDRIMAGELTMDDLKKELDNADLAKPAVDSASVTSGDEQTNTPQAEMGTSDSSGDSIPLEPITQDISLEPESINKNKINYGEPDTQLGNEIETVIPTETTNNFEQKNIEAKSDEVGLTNQKEAELATTYDKYQESLIGYFFLLGFVIFTKLCLRRRS